MVILLGVGGAAMALPAGHAATVGNHALARDFLYSGLIILVLTLLVAIALSGYRPANVARSHLLQLAGSYLLVPLALALPVTQGVPGISVLAAWFEMTSSFTTTGASLLDPATTPPSLHLWRALVGWMGGVLTLVAAVAILAPMTLGGFEVISGLAAGRGAGGPITGKPSRGSAPQITRIIDPAERIKRYAGQILPVYAGLTLVLWILLVVAGDPVLVGLCHAMSTLSTSGITPLAGFSDAPSGQWGQGFILLFLGFALTRRAFPGAARRMSGPPLLRDPEFRVGLAIAAGTVVIFGSFHVLQLAAPSPALLAATLWSDLFTVLSFLTTTGFLPVGAPLATAAGGISLPGLVLIALALTGGGVATTAGGIKLMRVFAMTRQARHEVQRLAHPHAVSRSGPLGRNLRERGAYAAWIFLMLFLITLAVVCGVLTLMGAGLQDAVVLAVAALSNTGPLAGAATGNAANWAGLSDTAIITLAAAMVLGRLEMLALVALIGAGSWRR